MGWNSSIGRGGGERTARPGAAGSRILGKAVALPPPLVNLRRAVTGEENNHCVIFLRGAGQESPERPLDVSEGRPFLAPVRQQEHMIFLEAGGFDQGLVD